MGRPPLNVKSTNIRISVDVRQRIEAVLSPGEKMAAFIRAAIERELAEREPKKPTKK
jgi:predicted DNA-binding protein